VLSQEEHDPVLESRTSPGKGDDHGRWGRRGM